VNKGFQNILLWVAASLLLSYCNDDASPSGNDVVLPSKFEAEMSIIDTAAGRIEIACNADGANYFSMLVEGTNYNSHKTSKDGKFEFDISPSGIYVLTAKAHVTENHFVEKKWNLNYDLIISQQDFDIGYKSPISYNGYNLIWQDEFEGNSIDETHWNFETGFAQNQELQFYRKENASIQNGYLDIVGNGNGGNYTSARLNTSKKFSFKFGRIDVRAKIPTSKGMWPAIWLLGQSYDQIDWPRCGEIDIMEYWGNPNGAVHGTIHWQNENNGKRGDTGGYKIVDDMDDLSSKFHVYSIVWDQNRIVWYLDNKQFLVREISAQEMSELREDFFVILNLAIGGTNPGNPDETSIFPSHMYVDYVRVFQKS